MEEKLQGRTEKTRKEKKKEIEEERKRKRKKLKFLSKTRKVGMEYKPTIGGEINED